MHNVWWRSDKKKLWGGVCVANVFLKMSIIWQQLHKQMYFHTMQVGKLHRNLVPYGLDRARLFLLKDNCPFFFYTLSSLNFSGLPINFMNDWSLQCNYILNYIEHLHPSSITRWKTSDEKKGPTSSILFLRQVLNT